MDPFTLAAIGFAGYWIFRGISEALDDGTQTTDNSRGDSAQINARLQPSSQPLPREHTPLTRPRQYISAEQCFNSEYVSYSRLRTYSSCPHKFQLTYLDGHRAFHFYDNTGPGKGFHHFCELTLKQAIGQPMPTLTSSAVKTRWPQDRKRYTIARRLLDKSSIVVAVEHELRFQFNQLDFFGIVDLVLQDPDGITHLVDFKTGLTPRAHLEQLELYCLPVLLAATDARVRCSFVLVDRQERISWELSHANRQQVLENIESIVTRIRSDREFIPRTGSHCQNCGVRHACAYHKFGLNSTDPGGRMVRLTPAKRGAQLRTQRKDATTFRGTARVNNPGSLFVVTGIKDYMCAETGERIPAGTRHFARKNGLRLSERGFAIRYPGHDFPQHGQK